MTWTEAEQLRPAFKALDATGIEIEMAEDEDDETYSFRIVKPQQKMTILLGIK